MPTLYNNSYFKKVTSILNKYLAFKANETFHPICTGYFIVNRYVPLDNKYYYYDKNFVALNYDYFRFSIRCMFFNDENSASCHLHDKRIIFGMEQCISTYCIV